MKWLAVLSLAVLAGGCGEPAFSAHLPDNNVADIQRAMATSKVDDHGPKNGRPTAYLVTQGEKHLVAFDIEGGQTLWDVPTDITSRLAVGRGFVAHKQGKNQIAVRNASNGALRCTIGLGADEQLLGIAAEKGIYYVVQSLSGATRVSYLVGASESCGESWRNEAAMTIGAPAVRGDLVAVPYAFQNVVLLDARNGAELARVRATDASVSFVRATPEGLFYGDDKGIYLLNTRGFDDEKLAGSRKGSAYAEAHLASSQIRTFYYWDAYQPSQADYTAFDRNHLLWRGEPRGDTVGFVGDAAVLHSYRYFFAFDAASGNIRWAYSHPRVDLVASDDTGPTIVYASVDGEVGALDAKSGLLLWSKKSGLKVMGASFDADGFAPPASKEEAPPLMKTLGGIVSDPDARFTAVKVFAIAAMAKVQGEEVTSELVGIVTKDGITPAVQKAAAEALLARKDEAARPLYRSALAVHTDYLNDKRPRGVDTLAKVVAVIGDQESAPLLASHLLDPATPLPALKEIVKSLVQLGGKDSIGALRDLLLTYRSDPSFLADPLSLEWAADGLLKLGGPEGRRSVLFVGEEPRTMAVLAHHIKLALGGKADEPADKKPEAPAKKKPAGKAAADAPPAAVGRK